MRGDSPQRRSTQIASQPIQIRIETSDSTPASQSATKCLDWWRAFEHCVCTTHPSTGWNGSLSRCVFMYVLRCVLYAVAHIFDLNWRLIERGFQIYYVWEYSRLCLHTNPDMRKHKYTRVSSSLSLGCSACTQLYVSQFICEYEAANLKWMLLRNRKSPSCIR